MDGTARNVSDDLLFIECVCAAAPSNIAILDPSMRSRFSITGHESWTDAYQLGNVVRAEIVVSFPIMVLMLLHHPSSDLGFLAVLEMFCHRPGKLHRCKSN